jgi:heme-degrading monooxygenase HmoA
MNYGVLSKIKVLSGNTGEVLEQMRQVTALSTKQGRAETAFYLSAIDHKSFYTISYWYSLQDFHEACAHPNTSKEALEFKSRRQVIEYHTFRLCWDYRQLHHPLASSEFRLLTCPDHYTEQNYAEIVATMRDLKGKLSGLNGVWLGRCLTPNRKRVFLQRLDWRNRDDQQSFNNTHLLQEALAAHRAQGMLIEYTSANFQGLVQPGPRLIEVKTDTALRA